MRNVVIGWLDEVMRAQRSSTNRAGKQPWVAGETWTALPARRSSPGKAAAAVQKQSAIHGALLSSTGKTP